MNHQLDRTFYQKDIFNLAVDLLGCRFVRNFGKNVLLSGRIVETEVYTQKKDPSSHSFKGRTKRNEVMFGEPGHLYVYFTYGMHFCCNVVCGPAGQGDAILIRALEPLEGIDEMMRRRFGQVSNNKTQYLNLTNGPAKLCQAFGIGRSENGLDLCGEKIWIESEIAYKPDRIGRSSRVGIKQGKELPRRYYIKDNIWVSRTDKSVKEYDE